MAKNSQVTGEQLNLDFVDDNMSAGCPTISIDSMTDTIHLGDDTITLGSGTYDFTHTGLAQNQININWPYNSLGGATITSSTGNLSPWLTTTNNTGGYGYTISNGTGYSDLTYNNTPGALQVKGDAHFEGDIKIKGKSIAETLEKIEEKLAIFKPNEKLEEKWDELRELRNRYVELEKEIIEKEKMWDILKK